MSRHRRGRKKGSAQSTPASPHLPEGGVGRRSEGETPHSPPPDGAPRTPVRGAWYAVFSAGNGFWTGSGWTEDLTRAMQMEPPDPGLTRCMAWALMVQETTGVECFPVYVCPDGMRKSATDYLVREFYTAPENRGRPLRVSYPNL